MAFIQMKTIYPETVDSTVRLLLSCRENIFEMQLRKIADLADINKMLHLGRRSKSHIKYFNKTAKIYILQLKPNDISGL